MSESFNKHPALRFIVPYSFEKYIERLHSLNGNVHVYSIFVAYHFRVSIHILDEAPSSATFVIETPQRMRSENHFSLSLSVVGTVERIDEAVGRTYIQIYRSPNWFFRSIMVLAFASVVALFIGIYWGTHSNGEPPALVSLVVICTMPLLPLCLWLIVGSYLENRRRFREIARRLGYPAPPNWITRRILRPIQRFIEGNRTLAFNLPYSMSDGLRRLHQLRDISKNNPAVDQLVISCPNKIDTDTHMIEFQIRRKAEGFGGDKLARLDGTIELVHNFRDRSHLTATYVRSQQSIERRRFVLSILGLWILILFGLAIVGITGILGIIIPTVVGGIGTILIALFARQQLDSNGHELIDILMTMLLSEKPKRDNTEYAD